MHLSTKVKEVVCTVWAWKFKLCLISRPVCHHIPACVCSAEVYCCIMITFDLPNIFGSETAPSCSLWSLCWGERGPWVVRWGQIRMLWRVNIVNCVNCQTLVVRWASPALGLSVCQRNPLWEETRLQDQVQLVLFLQAPHSLKRLAAGSAPSVSIVIVGWQGG